MATLSRSRAAGVALATLFALTLAACGGGGGGSTTEPPPPPPPPTDTTPPGVLSTTPSNGATDVDDSLTTVSVVMNETIVCPKTNPVTIMVDGEEVKGGTPACDAATATLSLTFQTKALYRCKTYTVALAAGVEDEAGNKAPAYGWTFDTKCPVQKMLFTVNIGGGTDWSKALSRISVSNGEVYSDWNVVEGDSSKQAAQQWALAADPETGLVYSGELDSFRGINIIDVATSAVTNVELDPSSHNTTEHIVGLALKDDCIWAAYSGMWVPYDPELRSRLFCVNRLTQQVTTKTAVVTDAAKSPLWLLAHPDPATHRLYSLNATRDAVNVGAECGSGVCQEVYLSGTPGTVTEVDSQTGAILRTFTVGSVPMDAVIDAVANRLFVMNVGDRSLSVVNLDTGTVGTVPLPEFTGYRQPAGIELMDGKLWVSDYLDSLWVYDFNVALVGSVSFDLLSMPESMTALDGKLYVNLHSVFSKAVAEVNADLTVNRRFSVGAQPSGIAGYVSGK